jgi:hypothetical protein
MTKRAKPDAGLRALITTHLCMINDISVHHQPIETALMAAGVPDLNSCWRGQEFWIECKKTSGWTCPLSEFQVGWALRRIRAGGKVFIATRRCCPGGTRTEEADELWLHSGRNALVLRTDGLKAAAPLIVTTGGPNNWNWQRVGRILVTV